jgi:uncharacterized membrane protein YhfC
MNITARILNFSLMLGMPFVLGLYLARKYKAEWRLFGIGVATFILAQLFHIPFNHWVLTPQIGNLGFDLTQGGFRLALVGILYGLSAGFFEEMARYLGYRVWIKEERDWKSALMFGAGHGGIESVLLGILVLIGFVQVIALQGTELSNVVDADQVETVRAQIQAYMALPWYHAILGAVERLATLPIHLGATVLVLQSFRRDNLLWLGLAVGWHAAVDALAVYAGQTWSVYITEGIVLVAGLLSLGIVFWLKSNNELALDVSHDVALPAIEHQPLPPSEENLDDSRYV